MKNQQIKLIKRPFGKVTFDCWNLENSLVPEPNSGEVLVRNAFISIDPAMRGWMNEGKSYIKPVALGDTMRALTVGKVMESKSEKFKTGEWVSLGGGVQNYVSLPESEITKIDTDFCEPEVYLGTLGMSGLTAYFGMLDTGQPKAGETVLISGAAGAVGAVAGQIAKLKGCKVVGIAGGSEKCKHVVENLGFDACVDYKEDKLRNQIKEVCPDGVDVFFDNVGGEILDTVLTLINKKARIIICGAISQYNEVRPTGPKNYLSLLVNRARMEGIVVFDNYKNYASAIDQMKVWIKDGYLSTPMHIMTGGVPAFPEALNQLFAGKNTGKMVLEC
jgi:NADPH-dependent curcumin reductase